MKNLNVSIAPLLEQLESRIVKSISLIDGQLQIKGTQSNDDITVDANDDPARIRVEVNGSVRRFNTADVGSIVISGLDGDDDIEVFDSVALPTLIYGGRGFDTLAGGSGRDAIYG